MRKVRRESRDRAGQITDAAGLWGASPGALLRVQRRIIGLAVIVCLFLLVQFVATSSSDAGHVASWWRPSVGSVLVLATMVVAGGVVAGSQRVMRVGAATSTVALPLASLAELVAWDGTQGATPAIGRLSEIAPLLCMIAAATWQRGLVIVYTALVIGVLRIASAVSRMVPIGDAVVVVATNVLQSVVVVVLVRTTVNVASVLDATWDDFHARAVRRAADRARAVERDRVCDIVHDWVLAALLAAARQPSNEIIRRHAHVAMRKFGRTGRDASGVLDAVDAAAVFTTVVRDADPDVTPDVSVETDERDSYPRGVVEALAAGVGEAVRNCHRHGGDGARCVVTVAFRADVVTAEVVDDGPGFDSGDRSPGYGLTRLRARLESIPGAEVVVTSVIGRGTSVRLRWVRPLTVLRNENREPVLGVPARTAWFGVALTFVTSVACAVATYRDVVTATTGVCLVTGAAVLLAWDRSDPPRWRATLAVVLMLSTAFGLQLVMYAAPMTAPQLWPTYFMVSFVPVLCLRGRAWAAVGVILLCQIPVLLLYERMGQPIGYWLHNFIGSAVTLLLGAFLASLIRPVARDVRRLRQRSADEHAAAAASAAAAETQDRYLAAFRTAAEPMLDTIARRPLDDAERRTAAVLEARLRSMIRAPGLVDRRIDAAADAARSRGADVVLIDDSASERLRGAARDAFAELVAAELDRAGAGCTVTIRLTPAHHEHPATIVAVDDRSVRRLVIGSDGCPVPDRTPEPAGGGP